MTPPSVSLAALLRDAKENGGADWADTDAVAEYLLARGVTVAPGFLIEYTTGAEDDASPPRVPAGPEPDRAARRAASDYALAQLHAAQRVPALPEDVMTDRRFIKGDRVTMTPECRAMFPGTPATGVVAHTPKSNQQVQILRDGRRSTESWAPSHWELTSDALCSQEFYDLMQTYRLAPITDQDAVVAAFEAVKAYVRAVDRGAPVLQPEPSEPSDDRLWAFGGAVASVYNHEYAQNLRDGVTEREAYARVCARLRELVRAVDSVSRSPEPPPKDRAEEYLRTLQWPDDDLARGVRDAVETHVRYFARWLGFPVELAGRSSLRAPTEPT